MGQNKSKEFETAEQDDADDAQIPKADVVRRHSQLLSLNEAEKRKRRKWRKKQGYSLPAVGGSMGNLNPEDEDLPPAAVERGAVLVSYSRSDAERFAPLRPRIVNRRKERQMSSFGDVTSDELFVDTPTSTRSCLTLDNIHGRCDTVSLANAVPTQLTSFHHHHQQQQQQLTPIAQHHAQQRIKECSPTCDNQPVPKDCHLGHKDLRRVLPSYEKSGELHQKLKMIADIEKDENIFPEKTKSRPMSYFEKVKQEIERSSPVFEKVNKTEIENDFDIIFNFEKVAKTSFEPSTPTSSQKTNFENGEKDLLPPPLPPRPSSLSSSAAASTTSLKAEVSPTSMPKLKSVDKKNCEEVVRTKTEVGPLNLMTHNSCSNNYNNVVDNDTKRNSINNSGSSSFNSSNICTVKIGPNICDIQNSKETSENEKRVPIPIPANISEILESGLAPNLFYADANEGDGDVSVEISVDDDNGNDDNSLTEPLELDISESTTDSMIMTSVNLDDQNEVVSEPFLLEPDLFCITPELTSEPLAIAQEPVSYFSRPSRVRDCDDDSALLIDDEDDGLVPAVRVETVDDLDDLDDFPAFCSNLSVVRPFGSDILSAITEEDKEDMSSNLSAVPESLDRSFSRSERDDEASVFENSFSKLHSSASAAAAAKPTPEINDEIYFELGHSHSGNDKLSTATEHFGNVEFVAEEKIPETEFPFENVSTFQSVEAKSAEVTNCFEDVELVAANDVLSSLQNDAIRLEQNNKIVDYDFVVDDDEPVFDDARVPNERFENLSEICVDDVSKFYDSDAAQLSVLPLEVAPHEDQVVDDGDQYVLKLCEEIKIETLPQRNVKELASKFEKKKQHSKEDFKDSDDKMRHPDKSSFIVQTSSLTSLEPGVTLPTSTSSVAPQLMISSQLQQPMTSSPVGSNEKVKSRNDVGDVDSTIENSQSLKVSKSETKTDDDEPQDFVEQPFIKMSSPRPQLEGAVENPIEPIYVVKQKAVVVVDDVSVFDNDLNGGQVDFSDEDEMDERSKNEQNEIEDLIDSIFQYDEDANCGSIDEPLRQLEGGRRPHGHGRNKQQQNEDKLVSAEKMEFGSPEMHSSFADDNNVCKNENSTNSNVDVMNEWTSAKTENKDEETAEVEQLDKGANRQNGTECTEEAIKEVQFTKHGKAKKEKLSQDLDGKEKINLDNADSAKQTAADKRRHFFDVSIVNTSQIETDVDTPNSSCSSDETETNSGFGSPPIEIRSERRLPPVGCSSEDPASSGSASDDLEKGCYDSLEEDSASSPPKPRLGTKDIPKRRRALPAVPPDYNEQQKRAFESLLGHQPLPQHVHPASFIQQQPPASFYVPYTPDKPFDPFNRFSQPFVPENYYEDQWRQPDIFFTPEMKTSSSLYIQPEPPIQQKVNLERSRTFNHPQQDQSRSRRRRELPQVPSSSCEQISQVDSPDEGPGAKGSVDRQVVSKREYRGNPPVPRWAHQGAGGFLHFSGEEDSGCASLDRSSVSPQQQQQQQQLQQQQQQAPEEDRESCSFMWFDMTPAPTKKPTVDVVRRQKTSSTLAAKNKLSMNRHSAPPGSLDLPRRRSDVQPTKATPVTTNLKRRKSSTMLASSNNSMSVADEKSKTSQSRFHGKIISAFSLTTAVLFYI